eukprot:12880930-Ditylum_brightwellii.AAC.1
MDDDGKYIAEALININASVVIDRSNKNIGASACVIEGPVHNTYHVTDIAIMPRSSHLHDAYRSELTELYQIMKPLPTHANPITLTSYQISDINQMISTLLIVWKWQHVKGHQGIMIGPLDRWTLLNVDMDIKSKARRRADKEDPPPIQQKLNTKYGASTFRTIKE